METPVPNSEILSFIRHRVRNHLTNSAAFRAMGRDQQVAVAHNTVKALNYIVAGEDGRTAPESVTMSGNHEAFSPASALAGSTTTAAPTPVQQTRAGQPAQAAPQRADRQHPGFGQAAREGSQAFTDMIADVNFPAFVAGLIDGVFNSIVTTSIKQMEAYAEMVKNVAKSVDQYMKDNVTEDNARDYLADKYPDHLQVDLAGDKPVLKPKEGADDGSLPDFFSDLGLKAPIPSLDEDNVEQQLVPAARRRIAMDRQQLLATMVMMGVNRLVVTNGTIEASCMFELDTTDSLKRASARTTDYDRTVGRTSESGQDGSFTGSRSWDGKWQGDNASGNWKGSNDYKANWYSKSGVTDTAKFKMTTVSSASSEQSINMHAQLGGKVKVNFKSDYFPMEKMVDALQVNQIRDKTAAGVAPPAQPAVPPPPVPALPPMPVAPGATAAPAPPAGTQR